MAKAALSELNLDEVIFIPCGYPPHKDINNVLSPDVRLKMTEMLICGESKMSVSDMEIKREGKSYTAKTLYELSQNNKDTTYFFIVGADSLCYMDDWVSPEIIFENAEIAVIGREGCTDRAVDDYIAFLENKYGAKIHKIYMPRVDVSSSMLREKLLRGEDISEYTGRDIYNLISEHIKHGRDN